MEDTTMKKRKCPCGRGFDTDNDGNCPNCATAKRKNKDQKNRSPWDWSIVPPSKEMS